LGFSGGTRFLRDEGLEGLESSLTIVGNTGFVTFWIPDKSWVTLNVDTFGLVSSSIKLGNNDVFVVFESFTERFPLWGKLFAMSAPWSIVLNENILGLVHDDLFILSTNNDGNWAIIRFWNWFGFEMWFDGTVIDTINEGTNSVNGVISWFDIGDVFLHVSWFDDSESWEVVSGDTHEFSESLLDAGGDISIREKNLTLMGNGSLIEGSLESGISISSSSEENESWVLLSEDGLDIVLSEFENGGDLEWLNPGLE